MQKQSDMNTFRSCVSESITMSESAVMFMADSKVIRKYRVVYVIILKSVDFLRRIM